MSEISYQVIRSSKRKTVSIQFDGTSVVVRAPKNLSEEIIVQIVQKKSRWIKEKLKIQEEVLSRIKPRKYIDGELYSFLGENYLLKVVDGKPGRVQLKHERFVVQIPDDFSTEKKKEFIRTQMIEWYQEHGLICLNNKVKRFSEVLGVSPSSVGIKSYKSRWGSCSRDGNLTFNWRVIMSPHRYVDYLVVHELCHLVHMNHSREYWEKVESIIHDYQECRNWFRLNGVTLNV